MRLQRRSNIYLRACQQFLNRSHPKVNNVATITVITATLNASKFIGRLAGDLVNQTDDDFTWLIVDGGSTDGTTDLLPEELRSRILIIRENDFGIYDALNKGIRRCNTTHYLVVGADDRLDRDAILQYKNLATIYEADIVAASVRDGNRIARSGRGQPWLRGQSAYLSHHSAGTLIRRSLHESLGFYSNTLPIAADQLFIKRAVQRGARLHCEPDFIAGEFCRDGVSSTRFTSCLFEFTLVQIQTERLRSLQILLLIIRLIRHWSKIVN